MSSGAYSRAKRGERRRLKSSEGPPRLPVVECSPQPEWEKKPTAEENEELGRWTPSPMLAFKALLSARMAAAIWNLMDDCDEVYNYWEPAHFMIYGRGFQTWEYAPQYALRSWAYVALHALPGLLNHLFLQTNPMMVFFFIRCLLGFLCALCELYFYRGIVDIFGPRIARLTLLFLVLSPGMFIASTAFLPSSFAMAFVTFAYGAWLRDKAELSIVCVALASLLGWPFAAILGLPIAVDLLFYKREYGLFFKSAAIALMCVLLPMTQIDSHLFGKGTVAPWNIVRYNLFTSHGPNLYGTEPWTYYVKNLLLNFNLIMPVAVLTAPLSLYFRQMTQLQQTSNSGARANLPARRHFPASSTSAQKSNRHLQSTQTSSGKAAVAQPVFPYGMTPLFLLQSLFVWVLIFFVQPHKEERFLYPIYPLICFAAAATLTEIEDVLCSSKNHLNQIPVPFKLSRSSFNKLLLAFVVLFGMISCSRMLARYRNHQAKLDVYIQLSILPPETLEIDPVSPLADLNAPRMKRLCLGKDWYHFPSHFFLPSTRDWEVQFIRSEFKGQLPGHFKEIEDNFSGPESTAAPRNDFNDANQMETSHLVDISTCHFLVDSDFGRETSLEPKYSNDTDTWEVLYSGRVIDVKMSNNPLRGFFIPFLSDSWIVWGEQRLLKRRRKTKKKTNGSGGTATTGTAPNGV